MTDLDAALGAPAPAHPAHARGEAATAGDQPVYNAHEVAASLLRPGRPLLDAGCGSGRFTRMAAELGCAVTAVDIEPEHCAELVGAGIRAHQADLEDPNWPEVIQWQRFDQVAALDVLEHLRDPLAGLRTLVDLVAPGGQLILSVPNVTHLDVRLELASGRFTYTDDGLLDRTHLRFFDRPALDAMLAAAGIGAAEVMEIRRDARSAAVGSGADPQLVTALAAAGDAAVQQWIVYWQPVPTPEGFLRRLMRDSHERAGQLVTAAGYARELEAQLESHELAMEQLRATVHELQQRTALQEQELAVRATALAAGGEYVTSLLDKLAQTETELADALLLQREVASQREVIAALATQAGQYQASAESLEASYRQLEAHHLHVQAEGQAATQAAQADAQALGEQLGALQVALAAAEQRAATAEGRTADAEHQLALARAGLGYQLIQPGTRLLARHPGLAKPLRPLARGMLRTSGS